MRDGQADNAAQRVAVIGGGPAGLMAAEVLSAAGLSVTVFERMPSLGRKLLIAGRGGLNLTHSEDFDAFVARYGVASLWMRPMLEAFPPAALKAWAEGLGQALFTGSSGRVFPTAMKASPLLRAWQDRLRRQHVTIRLRHDWQGWTPAGELVFATPDGVQRYRVDAVVLAMGGASWPKLGSNGAWADMLRAEGVAVEPFRPANAGFVVPWSERFRTRFAGEALKPALFRFGGRELRGEAVITAYGIEGGAIYALSSLLRDAIARDGEAVLAVDLKPGMAAEAIAARLESSRSGESLSNRLRKGAGLAPLGIALLHEGHGAGLPRDVDGLARAMKAVPIRLTAMQGLERAISSAGGVALGEVDAALMLRRRPGVFVAGEMLDWEAPTGGYLLQASFATGVAAAKGVLLHLGDKKTN